MAVVGLFELSNNRRARINAIESSEAMNRARQAIDDHNKGSGKTIQIALNRQACTPRRLNIFNIIQVHALITPKGSDLRLQEMTHKSVLLP